MKIFVAGAAGAIGKRLVPLLIDAGHEVFGTTRSEAKAKDLHRAGAQAVVVDVFDATALRRAVAEARPEIVIHQLTDLPLNLDPSRLAEALARNARIRKDGTRNLVAAALESGARRLIAQSIAWVYAPGGEPNAEEDPLDLAAEGTRAVTIGGAVVLERLTLQSPPLEGVVLRYGRLYGPGTGKDAPSAPPGLHVDAAALAALLAVDGSPGIYNIAEGTDMVTTDKARRELGWDAAFRIPDRARRA
jgi:nucleoside-diphosphate-sugar epimerase